jgi:MFS family permease
MAYFLLSLGSLAVCQILFNGIHSYSVLFLVLTFLAGALTAAFYGWLPLYLPELFPTRVRATGQGLSYNAGRILAAVGAVQMGSLMQTFEGSYAKAGAIITLIYVVGLGLIWLAPETKGKPLPE